MQTGCKWVRFSLRKLSLEMVKLGHDISLMTLQKKQEFKEAGLPIISIDTKKKELIGNFKNAGRAWGREAEQVNGHDFPSLSSGKATPYGIYDVTRNCGIVCVGKSADTPEFAVDAIVYWWETEGKEGYQINCSYWLMQAGAMVHAPGCGKSNCKYNWPIVLESRSPSATIRRDVQNIIRLNTRCLAISATTGRACPYEPSKRC